MQDIDKHELYEYAILDHVEQDSRLTNRLAAEKLGVSVKLAHQVLKRMVSKGLLHVNKVHSRRWDYFLTPKGIGEKMRLTMEFLDFSMHFYREARKCSSQLCKELRQAGHEAAVFLGDGDLAEIVYLGVREWGLELAAVYGETGGSFMNHSVTPLDELPVDLEAPLIVCLYDKAAPMRVRYLPEGLERRDNMHWVFTPELAARATVEPKSSDESTDEP